jgi:hypothetical protein
MVVRLARATAAGVGLPARRSPISISKVRKAPVPRSSSLAASVNHGNGLDLDEPLRPVLLVVSLGLLAAVTGRSRTTAPIDTAIGALLGVVGSLAAFW